MPVSKDGHVSVLVPDLDHSSLAKMTHRVVERERGVAGAEEDGE